MKYKGDYYRMWDSWFMNANGVIHGFHLKGHTGLWNVGHVVTDDLLHFRRCKDILNPLPEETHPEDCLGKYTGCAWYDDKHGRAYVYYTMRNRMNSEKIGVAVSEDFVNFKEYDGNPVLEVDKNVFVEKSARNGHTDCRDLLVLYDEKAKLYYGYFAAMAQYETGMKGVVGMAVSDDLISWRDQTIVYVPRFDGVVEVPDVFFMDGKWYLTVLTGSNYGAKGAVDDPNLVRVTLYASSDSPLGPFTEAEDNIFIGGGELSGYSCRSVMFENKRYLYYVEDNEYNGAISLPKEIRVVDGKLRPCYTDILKKIRTGDSGSLCAADFEKCSTSYAWITNGGEICGSDNRITATTNDISYQRYMYRGMKSGALEAEATVNADCRECGFVLETYDDHAPKERYYVSLNFDFSELIVYKDPNPNVAMFIPHSKRRYTFEKGRDYHVRAIAMDGSLEIYINGILALQGDMRTNKAVQPGIFCGSGSAVFSGLEFYTLE